MRIKKTLVSAFILLALPLLAGAGVNESVRVGDGETRDGSFTSVNGRVTIGDNATIRGSISSVNGGVRIGSNSRVHAATSVNGSVSIGSDSVVEDEISSVNGHIALDQRARARGLSTVNGGIDLNGAEIERDVHTINGDIDLRQSAVIGGSIIIEDRHSREDHRHRAQRITIADGSEVRGDIIVEDPDLEVEVILRGGGRVLGRIENARVVKE